MPYTKTPRPYKHEYEMQLKRNEIPAKLERQKARRELDKKGIPHKGKDVDHVKMLKDGGKNSDGLRVVSAHKNRSRNGHRKGES
jgi:hypothetical protein